MARSWSGLTIVACVPGIVAPQWLQSANCYEKSSKVYECYESVVVSRKILSHIRLAPALRHKAYFAYESIQTHASTWRDMHVHAVLSSFEGSTLLIPEDRMARWPHRPDV